MSYREQLNQYRNELDYLDEQIIELLNNRFDVTNKIGYLKIEHNQEIYQAGRESEIMDKLSKKLEQSEHHEAILKLYKELMKISRETQKFLK